MKTLIKNGMILTTENEFKSSSAFDTSFASMASRISLCSSIFRSLWEIWS